MLAVAAQRSEAVFAKTMRSRVVKFEENLIDNDNWRHGVKYLLALELLPAPTILFALKNSSNHYIQEIHTSVDQALCILYTV